MILVLIDILFKEVIVVKKVWSGWMRIFRLI